MRIASRCRRVVGESARHTGAMSRQQHCLVYSIDAILGLTGNGQRSASSTTGRRKCRESNDAFEVQQNVAACQNGRPGMSRLLA